MEASAGSPALLKRYIIHVGTGDWEENVALIPYVTVKGVTNFGTRLNGIITLSTGGEWSTGDGPGEISDCTLRGQVSIDFTATGVVSPQGRMYFNQCIVNPIPVTFNAFSSVNQLQFRFC